MSGIRIPRRPGLSSSLPVDILEVIDAALNDGDRICIRLVVRGLKPLSWRCYLDFANEIVKGDHVTQFYFITTMFNVNIQEIIQCLEEGVCYNILTDMNRCGIYDPSGSYYLCRYAAKNGHIPMLQWARKHRCHWDSIVLATMAAEHGHLNVLQLLQSHGAARLQRMPATTGRSSFFKDPMPWTRIVCEGAARGGHLQILQWVRAQNPPCYWDERTCASAAEGGELTTLQWLRAQDPPCPWDEQTCAMAAKGGHLEILRWAVTQDPPCPWSASTCSNAATGGQFTLLQWLRGQDPPCPWNSWTCANAAAGDHLEMLQWARSQDPPCPWDSWTCRSAAINCHFDTLQWARAQEPPCPCDAQTSAIAATNARYYTPGDRKMFNKSLQIQTG